MTKGSRFIYVAQAPFTTSRFVAVKPLSLRGDCCDLHRQRITTIVQNLKPSSQRRQLQTNNYPLLGIHKGEWKDCYNHRNTQTRKLGVERNSTTSAKPNRDYHAINDDLSLEQPTIDSSSQWRITFDWERRYFKAGPSRRQPWHYIQYERDLLKVWKGRAFQNLDESSDEESTTVESTLDTSSDAHFGEYDRTMMYGLCKELLAIGRETEKVAQQWMIGGRMKVFLPLMYFLFERRCSHLALRFLEGYLSTYLNVPTIRALYQAEGVDSVYKVFLKDARYSYYKERRMYKQRPVLKRSGRLIDLIILMSRQKLYYAIPSHIRLLLHSSNPQKSLELYESLGENDIFLVESVHLLFLSHFAKHSLFAQAFRIFQNICEVHIRIGDTFASLSRLWAFRELFVQLYWAGVPIHTSNLLDILLSYGEKVDNYIYHTFIFSAAKAGDAIRAESLFENLETLTDSKANLHTYTALFNMYHGLSDRIKMKNMEIAATKAGLEPERSVFFVNAMLYAELELEHRSYGHLLDRYRQYFSTDPLERLHLPCPIVQQEQINTQHKTSELLTASTATVSIMARAFLKQRPDSTRAVDYYTNNAWMLYQQYLRNLEDPSSPPQFNLPSEHFFSIFVATLGRERSQLPKAVSVIHNMLSSPKLPDPTIICWNPLLRSYGRHKDINGAEKIWDMIVNYGLTPDNHSYNALVAGYILVDMNVEAGRLLARMISEGWNWNWKTHIIIDISKDKKLLFESFAEEKRILGMNDENSDEDNQRTKKVTRFDIDTSFIFADLPFSQ